MTDVSFPPTDARRVRLAGVLATVVTFGAILLATVLDPTFSWTGDALSDLGVRPRSAPVFNGGLIAGGFVGCVYATGLGVTATTRVGRVVAAVFGLAMVGLAGVGVFDLTHALHLPAAAGFYLLATLAFALDGLSRRGEATGRVALAFAPVHLLGWWTWIGGHWPGVDGLALPELFGALLVAAWVWLVGPLPVVAAARDAPLDGGPETDGD